MAAVSFFERFAYIHYYGVATTYYASNHSGGIGVRPIFARFAGVGNTGNTGYYGASYSTGSYSGVHFAYVYNMSTAGGTEAFNHSSNFGVHFAFVHYYGYTESNGASAHGNTNGVRLSFAYVYNNGIASNNNDSVRPMFLSVSRLSTPTAMPAPTSQVSVPPATVAPVLFRACQRSRQCRFNGCFYPHRQHRWRPFNKK